MPVEKEWFQNNYYKTLGVDENATDKEITRAYRKLAKELHPDVNKGSEEQFKKVSEAYEVLSDDTKRKEYDQMRKLGPNPGFSSNGSSSRVNFKVDDLSDIFSGFFNGGTATRSQNTTTFTKQKGQDVETTYRLSFEDAINGKTETLSVNYPTSCHECNGSGAAKGSGQKVCDKCMGSGYVQDGKNLFSLNQECDKCMGRGTIPTVRCPVCLGTGKEYKPTQVTIKLGAGTSTGQKVRIKGKGKPGLFGGPNGDLYVKLTVEPHKLFVRKGLDIYLTVPITFYEAVTGAKISVPDVRGQKIVLKVPQNCPNGRILKVAGKGVITKTKAGDFYVELEVQVPKSINEAQQRAIEEFEQNRSDDVNVRENIERYIKTSQEVK